MGKKYFVVSDIHSCFTPFVRSLSNSGFRLSDKEHVLVLLGDLFDRGQEPVELYRFLQGLPKERRILVKGNHEDAFLRICREEEASESDSRNGTLETLGLLAGGEKNDVGLFWVRYVKRQLVKNGVLSFFESDDWKDFVQIGKYLLLHAFFPIEAFDSEGNIIHDFDWRHPDSGIVPSWEQARWMDPLRLFQSQEFDEERRKGTILVSGHVPTRDYRHSPDDSIFRIPQFIGLDGGGCQGGRINVLVLDPEKDPMARNEGVERC